MARRIALVTDSSASLPNDVAAARGISVVPLQVVVGATAYDEGDGLGPAELAQALQEWKPVSTSRPAPERFLTCYRELADKGVDEVVSIHLSALVSGTFESAQLAAKEAPIPVTCIDSRQVGIGTGFLVLGAADLVEAGADVSSIVDTVQRRAETVTSLFYVDTLEHLRRGGRVGAAAAFLGSALAVKPILRIEEGRISPAEKVRTAGRALARLEELALEAARAADGPVDVGVSHLASPERADVVATKLAEQLADELEGREVVVGEIGAALGAHVGPGMVAIVVAPRG